LSAHEGTQGVQPSAAPFKDHFSLLAAQYSQFRPMYPAALFEYLAGLCPRREQAWDCACGNGQASVSLGECFESVIATDAAAAQIAAAQPHPKVHYRCARAEASALAPACVDLVTVAQALHWLDLESFYAEVRRVLRPAGVLAVWCYGRVEVEDSLIDTPLQSLYREVVGPFWPPERAHVEDGYASLPFPFAPLPAPAFAMETRWSLAHLMGYVRSWSATAAYIKHHGHDPVGSLEKQLEPLWGDPQRSRRITWPLSLRVGLKAS
jgi:SAM-dependent methyltransferase